MAVKLWTKPQTQGFIKRLRAAGYTVDKSHTGKYSVTLDGKEVFGALPGVGTYLVRVSESIAA